MNRTSESRDGVDFRRLDVSGEQTDMDKCMNRRLKPRDKRTVNAEVGDVASETRSRSAGLLYFGGDRGAALPRSRLLHSQWQSTGVRTGYSRVLHRSKEQHRNWRTDVVFPSLGRLR